jgi:hypothetical protein
MAPNITARWEMDLSPGTQTVPFNLLTGWIVCFIVFSPRIFSSPAKAGDTSYRILAPGLRHRQKPVTPHAESSSFILPYGVAVVP